tara:strand:- start:267 stop:2009 length:1743 start_codon:yes stop_codon:yes gene_type:complete
MAKIIKVGDALWSMRNAPYTTISAIAELIDNSLQAKATNISLIAVDRNEVSQAGANLSRLDKLAVYDNGIGMDPETLQNCLSVGFSRNKEDPEGIGKFGYGMSVGSISQSFKVEVFSWQSKDSINYTYLDLHELRETEAEDIPEIIQVKKIPLFKNLKKDEYLKITDSGTLVIWSNLDKDRVKTKTSKGVVQQFNNGLARIYRHFLDDDNEYGEKRRVEIVNLSPEGTVTERSSLLPNDPLYLLTPNTLPDPHNTQRTNEIHAEFEHPVDFVNEEGEQKKSLIQFKFTVAKPSLRTEYDGSTDLGKHYARNQGVSFVRAAREIQLDDFGFLADDPRERWWGCEIRFKPELDKLFGVSADKQRILNIKRITDREGDEYFEDAKTDTAIKLNVDINRLLRKNIGELRSLVRMMATKQKTKKGKSSTENKVNKRVKEDDTETVSGTIEKTREEKIEEYKTLFQTDDPNLTDDEALERAKERVDYQVDYLVSKWPGKMFLSVESLGGGIVAKINVNSEFYDVFINHLENAEDVKGIEAVKIILMAFARTEDELGLKIDPEDKIFNEFRERWGYWISQLIEIATD